jgi:hypothetical protein
MVLALLLVSVRGQASTILFATLTNSQENPPTVPTNNDGSPRPASFGFATFTLNDAQTEMAFVATIYNIDVTGSQTPLFTNDNLGNAHIHAGPNFPPVNNSVAWGFFGAPFNDNAPNDSSFVPFANGVGGTFSGIWNGNEGNNTTLTAALPFILSNRAYINFHTTQFGGGEIRGVLVATPEPGTLALFGLGGVMLRLRRRFTKR